MQRMKASVTTTGTTGSALGNATFTPGYVGLLHAVYLEYASGITSTTDVTIAQGIAPEQDLLAVSNNTAAGWYMPRSTHVDSAGAAQPSTAGQSAYPVSGPLTLAVGSSTPIADCVTAYLYIQGQ